MGAFLGYEGVIIHTCIFRGLVAPQMDAQVLIRTPNSQYTSKIIGNKVQNSGAD